MQFFSSFNQLNINLSHRAEISYVHQKKNLAVYLQIFLFFYPIETAQFLAAKSEATLKRASPIMETAGAIVRGVTKRRTRPTMPKKKTKTEIPYQS
jgi:hypothetical protein